MDELQIVMEIYEYKYEIIQHEKPILSSEDGVIILGLRLNILHRR